MAELKNHDYEAVRAEMKIEQLQAENAAMREALEAVEWVFRPPNTRYCPWCNHSQVGEHAPDCLRQLALADAARCEMLERLRRAERTLELLEAAGHVPAELMARTHKIVSSFEEVP